MLLVCLVSGLTELVCSSLGKAPSLAPRFSQLSEVLHVEFWPHGLFPIHFGMFIGVILVQFMNNFFTWKPIPPLDSSNRCLCPEPTTVEGLHTLAALHGAKNPLDKWTAQNSWSYFWTTFWMLRLLGFPVYDHKQDAKRYQPQIFFPVCLGCRCLQPGLGLGQAVWKGLGGTCRVFHGFPSKLLRTARQILNRKLTRWSAN